MEKTFNNVQLDSTDDNIQIQQDPVFNCSETESVNNNCEELNQATTNKVPHFYVKFKTKKSSNYENCNLYYDNEPELENASEFVVYENELQCNEKPISKKKAGSKPQVKRGPYQRKIIKKIYKCEECNEVFIKFINYRDHMKAHREDYRNSEKYQCPKCPEKFVLKIKLKKHVSEHNMLEKEEKLECSECEYYCYSKVKMEKHLKDLHTKHIFVGDAIESIEKIKPKTKKKPKMPEAPLKFTMQCDLCALCFNIRGEVFSHERFHKPDIVKWTMLSVKKVS